MAKDKRKGLSLDMRTFQGESGKTYLVFRENKSTFNSYHVFQEVEAKEAANDCGGKMDKQTIGGMQFGRELIELINI